MTLNVTKFKYISFYGSYEEKNLKIMVIYLFSFVKIIIINY